MHAHNKVFRQQITLIAAILLYSIKTRPVSQAELYLQIIYGSNIALLKLS